MITLLFYFLFGPGKYNEMQRNGLNKSIIKRTSDNFAKAIPLLIIIDLAIYVAISVKFGWVTPPSIKIAILFGIMVIFLIILMMHKRIKLQRYKAFINDRYKAFIDKIHVDSNSVFYDNESLENIAKNAESIYKSRTIKKVKFNDVWLETIQKLCQQAEIASQLRTKYTEFQEKIKEWASLNENKKMRTDVPTGIGKVKPTNLIYPVRHFNLRADDERVESGPVQFGSDWKGLFLRGDNCMVLKMEIERLLKDARPIDFGMCMSVIDMINEVLSPDKQLDANIDRKLEIQNRLDRFEIRKKQLLDLGFKYDEFREYNFSLPGIWSCFWEQVYNPTDEDWADYLNAVKEAIERHNNKS
jgi:hypothetical protein